MSTKMTASTCFFVRLASSEAIFVGDGGGRGRAFRIMRMKLGTFGEIIGNPGCSDAPLRRAKSLHGT